MKITVTLDWTQGELKKKNIRISFAKRYTLFSLFFIYYFCVDIKKLQTQLRFSIEFLHCKEINETIVQLNFPLCFISSFSHFTLLVKFLFNSVTRRVQGYLIELDCVKLDNIKIQKTWVQPSICPYNEFINILAWSS